MKRKPLIVIICFLMCCHFMAFAQSSALSTQLQALTKHSDSLINHFPPEKIHIQFDKPDYTMGDTIWFKAYVFNGASHFLSSRSGLLHVDIANDSNRVVKQYLFAVFNGLCPGNIILEEKQYKSGNYTIRAYTQWMRNFSEDGFYFKRIRIADAGENSWLVKNRVDTSGNGTHIRARMLLSRLDNIPMGDSILQAEVLNGKKVLYKQKVQADKNGLLDINFNLPANANPSIMLENGAKSNRAVIPINLNRPQNIDVQFMPEGGNLAAGLPSRIGFKAIGEDGRGVDINGIVLDKAGRQVAVFKSGYKGIGSFSLQIGAGEQYTAKVALPGSLIMNYPLPPVKPSSLALQVENTMQSDSVMITLSATPDLVQAKRTFFLLGKSRGVICYAGVLAFQNNNAIRKTISKSLFPTGIAHFIVLTPQGQPLNERLTYIDRRDELHISVEPGKATYLPKDSIALQLRVTDSEGQPAPGNFSLAVTDDAQVKTDSLDDDDILTRLLLTSDLKGYVETPGYYFHRDNESWQALDNLLLTQGWVGYEPLSETIAQQPEKEYTVSGRVNNVFNAPVKKTDILLFSNHPSILMDTLTDEEGRFTFNRFPRADTPVFVLQARNRHGKSFNVNIKVQEITQPAFNAPQMPALMPWYVNMDTTLGQRLTNNILVRRLQDSVPGINTHHLKEVKIIGKKLVKGSENLNGPGNADIVLDEKDVEAAGKKSFLQLFAQTIPGFTERDSMRRIGQHYELCIYYTIYRRVLHFIVDGVMITRMYPNLDLKQYLEFNNAEDIKGIEVAATNKYVGNYLRRFFPADMVSPDTMAFIEITTRSGSPMMPFEPGVYLYKPLAITWPKQFYKPRYAVNDTTKKIDWRSTIDWEPNIVTDARGQATVSFFAGTQPTTYTILVQGTDMNGNIGLRRKKIAITKAGDTAKSK